MTLLACDWPNDCGTAGRVAVRSLAGVAPGSQTWLRTATQGLTGFLKRSTHEEHYGDSAELKVGMLVEVAVTSVMDRRLAHVTTEPTAVAGSVVKDWDGLDIGACAEALARWQTRHMSNGPHPV